MKTLHRLSGVLLTSVYFWTAILIAGQFLTGTGTLPESTFIGRPGLALAAFGVTGKLQNQ